jgi:hypothetical protein
MMCALTSAFVLEVFKSEFIGKMVNVVFFWIFHNNSFGNRNPHYSKHLSRILSESTFSMKREPTVPTASSPPKSSFRNRSAQPAGSSPPPLVCPTPCLTRYGFRRNTFLRGRVLPLAFAELQHGVVDINRVPNLAPARVRASENHVPELPCLNTFVPNHNRS